MLKGGTSPLCRMTVLPLESVWRTPQRRKRVSAMACTIVRMSMTATPIRYIHVST